MVSILRRYPRVLYIVTTLSMYVQIAFVFGLALAIGIMAFRATATQLDWLPEPLQLGFAGGVAFLAILFGLALIIICICQTFRLKIREGIFPSASLDGIRWATYNFYILLHRYTVMNFIRATPFQPWFYRLLGAKIGKGVQINTVIIGDCNLITIGNFAMIGGDATVVCHSYERGHLVIRPVVIGDYADIGLNAVILPGVTVGDHATVAAGAIVPKNTQIPPHTVWAGVPARQIRDRMEKPHSLAETIETV
jgi:acetyltransferase-like isoleucine patch superfamily enzyme